MSKQRKDQSIISSVCQRCENVFIQGKIGRHRIFCCDGNERRGVFGLLIACQNCDRVVPASTNGLKKFCSIKCARECEKTRRPKTTLDCKNCGTVFLRKNASVTCSKRCSEQWYVKNNRQRARAFYKKRIVTRKCRRCGDQFITSSKWYCDPCVPLKSRWWHKNNRNRNRSRLRAAAKEVRDRNAIFTACQTCGVSYRRINYRNCCSTKCSRIVTRRQARENALRYRGTDYQIDSILRGIARLEVEQSTRSHKESL